MEMQGFGVEEDGFWFKERRRAITNGEIGGLRLKIKDKFGECGM